MVIFVEGCGRVLGSTQPEPLPTAPLNTRGPAAPAEAVSLGAALHQFLGHKAAVGCRPIYVTTLRRYLGAFIRGRERAPVASLSHQDVDAWFAGRTEKACARNANLGRLSSFFTYCSRRGWCEDNPAKKVERARVDQRTPGILTPKIARRLLAICRREDPAMLPYFVLGLYVGIRPDEVRRLTWEAIDLGRALVTVSGAASKVRRRRVVPLHPKAVAWLRWCRGMDHPLVPRSLDGILRRSRKVRRRAGVPREQDILRHTAASYLVALHQDLNRVSYWLGNSPVVLLKHYHELVDPADCRRFWKTKTPNP